MNKIVYVFLFIGCLVGCGKDDDGLSRQIEMDIKPYRGCYLDAFFLHNEDGGSDGKFTFELRDYVSEKCLVSLYLDNELSSRYRGCDVEGSVDLSKCTDGEHTIVVVSQYERYSEWLGDNYIRNGIAIVHFLRNSDGFKVFDIELNPSYRDSYVVSVLRTGLSAQHHRSDWTYCDMESYPSIDAYSSQSELDFHVSAHFYSDSNFGIVVNVDDVVVDTVNYIKPNSPVLPALKNFKIDELGSGYHEMRFDFPLSSGYEGSIMYTFTNDSLWTSWSQNQ